MKSETEGQLKEFLEQHQPSRFKRFLENSYIYIDYEIEDLKRINNRISETGEYDFSPYAINYGPVPESGTLKTNLLEVVELPETLYTVSAADGLTTSRFYSQPEHDILPIHFHDGTIYTLIDLSEISEATTEMCSDESPTTTSFESFATSDPSEPEVNIAKVLLRGVVTTIANRVGAVVNRERHDTRIYMRHDGEDVDIDGKWAAKQLDTEEVRHRSVTVFVKFFSETYYLGLYPSIEFTTDGKHLVSGSRKKSLSDGFNPGKFPQNSRKSATVDIWLSKLVPC
jgi:hypothetical protein